MKDAAARGPRAPLLLFDGDCGFCTACVEWLAARMVRRARMLPWQRADLAALGLSRAEAEKVVWWIEPDGRRLAGARAMARALEACRPPWRAVGRGLRAPGARRVADGAYALVSRARGRLPGTRPACRRADATWEVRDAELRYRE